MKKGNRCKDCGHRVKNHIGRKCIVSSKHGLCPSRLHWRIRKTIFSDGLHAIYKGRVIAI